MAWLPYSACSCVTSAAACAAKSVRVGSVAPAATARIEHVWVSPGAREIGFGDDLLAAATAIARTGGAVAIEAEALPGDRETKNLYERAGVTARKLVVWKALDPPGE